MEDTVKGRTLRKIGENLARFADIRETAKEPKDRIVVQANGSEVKLVAGSMGGTLIASVHATSESGRTVVPSRFLLQALKNADLKGDYRFVNLNKGFEIGCALERIDKPEVEHFLRVDKKLPVILLPPALDASKQGSIPLEADRLEEMGNILNATADWFDKPVNVLGQIYTNDGTIRFAAQNNIRFASINVKGDYGIFGRIEGDFLEAARGIGDSIMHLWTDGKVTIENDTFRAVGRYEYLSSRGPVNIDGLPENIQYKAVVDRTKFVKSIREQAKLDKRGRFALQYNDNVLNVVSFDAAKHGWFAKAENMLAVLTATKAKQVGIGLRTGSRQPINIRIPEWTIEIAPVVLEPAK